MHRNPVGEARSIAGELDELSLTIQEAINDRSCAFRDAG